MALTTRSIMVIVYEDSVFPNWRDKLKSYHIDFAISPLHDKDVENGHSKKPHYHVLLRSDGKHSLKQWLEIMKSINCYIPMNYDVFPETVKHEDFFVSSVRGAFRYLCHLDDPNKFQYSTEDIYIYGSFFKERFEKFLFDEDNDINIFLEILSFCEDNNVKDIYRLLFLVKTNKIWLEYIYKNYGRLNCILRSKKEFIYYNDGGLNND